MYYFPSLILSIKLTGASSHQSRWLSLDCTRTTRHLLLDLHFSSAKALRLFNDRVSHIFEDANVRLLATACIRSCHAAQLALHCISRRAHRAVPLSLVARIVCDAARVCCAWLYALPVVGWKLPRLFDEMNVFKFATRRSSFRDDRYLEFGLLKFEGLWGEHISRSKWDRYWDSQSFDILRYFHSDSAWLRDVVPSISDTSTSLNNWMRKHFFINHLNILLQDILSRGRAVAGR